MNQSPAQPPRELIDPAGIFPAVSAIVYSLIQERNPDPHFLATRGNAIVNFVFQQQSHMTDYLRLPVRIMTRVFDLGPALLSLKTFHQLPHEKRIARIGRWRTAKSGVKRDLVRFYESLVALAMESDDVVEATQAPPVLPVVASGGLHRHEIAIIGSGPGGAVTAAILAEAGRDVILIEEGEHHAPDSCPPFSITEMAWKYRNGGLTAALGSPKIAYVEGKCVGGGSEINSGLYHRTPGDILERWKKEYGVENLSADELAPHFEACERDLGIGVMPMSPPAASLKLHQGAQSLGWRSMQVPRWYRYVPATSDAGAPLVGVRQSMSRTYVPRALAAGCTLLPQTRAVRFSHDGVRWTITARRSDGSPVSIEATHLFISCGAIQTPALLRKSGIRQHVGKTLRLHPTIKFVAEFAEPINSGANDVGVHQVKEFSPRFSFGCSISSNPYLSLALLDQAAPWSDMRQKASNMAVYYAMITGQGWGSVRPMPGFDDPLVRYRLTDSDMMDLGEALRHLGRALFAAGAVALYPSIAGAPAIRTPAELDALPRELPRRQTNLMTIHAFSSCPMGENRDLCAADSFGRVRGVDKLRIADASLLCTAPGVNPQGSIMAICRRNALHFLEEH